MQGDTHAVAFPFYWLDVDPLGNTSLEAQAPRRRPTISEIETILEQDDEVEIEILPNGEIRAHRQGKPVEGQKPLTMRDNLGGEYACRITTRSIPQ